MKNIGVFFDRHADAVEAYRKHSHIANNMARVFGTVTVNPAEMTINIDKFR